MYINRPILCNGVQCATSPVFGVLLKSLQDPLELGMGAGVHFVRLLQNNSSLYVQCSFTDCDTLVG